MRCSGLAGWKTSAMIYEGLERKYYYCYQCRRWSTRHYRFRYAVAPLDDPQIISILTRQLESQKEFAEAQMESLSWFRRTLSAARSFFGRYAPW
jgi:uncharacterized CHY-type Zn-finger protein